MYIRGLFLTISFIISISALFLVTTSVTHAAATREWDGGGSTMNFSDAQNWVGDVAPVNGDSLVFNPETHPLTESQPAVNDIANLSAAGLAFHGSTQASVSSYITGNQLTISGPIYAGFNSVHLCMNIKLAANIDVTSRYAVYFCSPVSGNPVYTVDLAGFNISAENLIIWAKVIGNGNFTSSTGFLSFGPYENSFKGTITMYGDSELGAQLYNDPSGDIFHNFGDSANRIILNDSSLLDIHSQISSQRSNSIIPNSFTFNTTAVSEYYTGTAVEMNGAISLTREAKMKVTGSDALTFSGELSGPGKITLADGSNENIIINASSNSSGGGNGSTGSSITVTDKKPSTNMTVNSGITLTIEATGERGDIAVNGGVLKGLGRVGDITLSNGSVAPGMSPGILNSGDFTATGGSFQEEIGGNNSGEYDMLNVTGTVNLGSATTLNVSHWNNYRPALGGSFTIINNDGVDAVTGTFQGLPESGTLLVDGVTYAISYKGGDGNDVVLTVTGASTTSASTLKAPNTGMDIILNNPFTSIVATIVSILGLYIAYRYNKFFIKR